MILLVNTHRAGASVVLSRPAWALVLGDELTCKKCCSAKIRSGQCMLRRKAHVAACSGLALMIRCVSLPAGTSAGVGPVEGEVLLNQHRNGGQDVESSHRTATL